jgi:drug/metabolite transporter (DMT)-like permease
MASSELPSGILMGALFVGDPLGAPEVIGVLIILVGLVLSQFNSLRPSLAAVAQRLRLRSRPPDEQD